MTEPTTTPTRRKLIEVSLPLEEINRGLKAEKARKVGKPQHIHHWWARRPITAARAVLFAQLVDDPSSDPDRFPTAQAQEAERRRLHGIVARLAQWDAIDDEVLLRMARHEINRCTGDSSIAILDPFAGGGAIPMEAQRLGLEARASDLNPVAALINRALVEIPPKFADRPPVFPGATDSKLGDWPRATGIAEDVRHYGAWMRQRATERIGHIYPKATLPDGSTTSVISWLWARTVTCPNPACGVETPLVESWWLCKKRGKEAYVVPRVENDAAAPSGRRVNFEVSHDLRNVPTKDNDGTMAGRSGARCVVCGASTPMDYIKDAGREGFLGAMLMAVVAEGPRRRIYLAPTPAHSIAAEVTRPVDVPDQELGYDPRNLWTPAYGLRKFSDLFTDRQLLALTTFSDLVSEVRARVLRDMLATGASEGEALCSGGSDALAYADAVATYLAMALSRLSDWSSSLCRWESSGQVSQQVFGRQAIPMVWDFSEANTLASSSGSFAAAVDYVATALAKASASGLARVEQADAASVDFRNVVVSTDPPYYDNIGYSDLSDYFYVWLRRSLQSVHPDLFRTLLVPKAEELVANQYRHGGKAEAEAFFEDGFFRIFATARQAADGDFPITVYYAFKQQERSAGNVLSTGWATILEGILRAGWSITATWPLLTESSRRLIASGTNALASSIVLALRPRNESAQATTRRGFLAALKAELPQALRDMQQGAIAPVDLAQSTIGPGMAVFSRYSKVVEADGSAMSVKTALALINQALDEVLAEQDGDLDADTRFCVKWYAQYGWSEKAFGEADVLARATNTSVDGLARGGVLTSRAGRVRLLPPQELRGNWSPDTDDRLSVWEATMHLARVLESGGLEAAGVLVPRVGQRVDLETVQLLAYRLYEMTQSARPSDALLFNALGTSWSDLASVARRTEATRRATQAGFDFDALNEE